MAEHLVAVFETDSAATAARRSLESAGIPASSIRHYASNGANHQDIAPTEHTSTQSSGGGFWSWLFGEESTSETTRSAYTSDTYDRRAAAGNVVLSVTVDDDAKIHRAITALEAHNPIEINERSDEEGETASTMAPVASSSATGRDFSTGEVARPGMMDTTASIGYASGTDATVTPGAKTTSTPGLTGSPSAATAAASRPDTPGRLADAKHDEQVLPLSEEQLEIGKRTVDHGTTRIHRYVVSKPVEENITLHGERVLVERRQPLETTGTSVTGAFEERVLEVRETTEEPVVAKTARVVEEVVVGREATERTETVRDTVRREEVEISKGDEVRR